MISLAVCEFKLQFIIIEMSASLLDQKDREINKSFDYYRELKQKIILPNKLIKYFECLETSYLQSKP